MDSDQAGFRKSDLRFRPLALAVILLAFVSSLVSANHCALTGQHKMAGEAVSCCSESRSASPTETSKSDCCILAAAPLPATAALPVVYSVDIADLLPAVDVSAQLAPTVSFCARRPSVAESRSGSTFVSVDLRRIVAALAPPRIG